MHGLGREQKDKLGSRQYLLRRFCASGFGYWRVGGERSAWLLTSGLFCLILLNLGVSYELNVWNRTIFDGLQQRDSAPCRQRRNVRKTGERLKLSVHPANI
jgi:putative ATP-binding cassette transporter